MQYRQWRLMGTIMAPPAQIADGLTLFAESEILPALAGWKLGIAAAAVILFRQRIDRLIPTVADNKIVSALGLSDTDGNIDVEAAAEALKESIRKAGNLMVDIPLLGTFKFKEVDIDQLLEYMRAFC